MNTGSMTLQLIIKKKSTKGISSGYSLNDVDPSMIINEFFFFFFCSLITSGRGIQTQVLPMGRTGSCFTNCIKAIPLINHLLIINIPLHQYSSLTI